MEESQDIDSIKLHIRNLIESRRLSEARRVLSEAMLQNARDLDLLGQRAYVDYLEGKHDAAETGAKQILAADSKDYSARMILILSYEDRKRYREAEELIIGLLRDYPEDAGAYVRYSRLMLRTLNFDKAETFSQEAIRLDPASENSRIALALCRHVKGKIDPDVDLAQLIRNNPESVSTIRLLIAALVDRKQYRRALRLTQELVRAHPDEQDFIDQVIELKVVTHWLQKPLWPMRRFGWAGSVAVLVIAVVGTRGLEIRGKDELSTVFISVMAIYVIYGWVAPPLLRMWYKRGVSRTRE